MWSYYGSKSKIVKYYPRPKYGKIIEPFAGSARYALKYWDREVLLMDKSKDIIDIWHYIQKASPEDIKRMKCPAAYSKIDRKEFDCDGQFLLMKYLIVQGAFRGNYTVSKWGAMRFERNRKNIVENMHKVKDWTIVHGCYTDLPNEKATWFIDPPYVTGGHKYPQSNKRIDYQHLGEWCRQREGQVIVCENSTASWMDFQPLVRTNTSKGFSHEVMYTNAPDILKLFPTGG